MLAFIADELGSLENFKLRGTEPDSPAPGEVLLQVEATGLGFVDQLVMRGLYQVKPPVPFVPGGEIVGRVLACGEGVEGFRKSQRVACWQYGGGLAEQTIIAAKYAVAVPDALEAGNAAALLLDMLTAYYALFDRGGLKTGQSLLVTGASGGVGSAAVQLGAANGARVVALASGDEKRALVGQLGADSVVDYQDENWRAAVKRDFPAGVDMVFDPVGGSLLEPCFRSLAKKGRHLVIGFASGDGIASLPANLPLLKSGELVGVDARYLWESDPARIREILSVVLEMAASSRIEAVVARRFPLEMAAEAIAFVTSKDRIGKTIVVP
ncbi:NADPH:quinone oxidoreductase family protein [Qipengyuania sp. MTN3-11]|uniref:NADPH:quinone oxidoreductase family protein n=1 Tax=Qipengyuania sp. MTN3-11 TaxID=3056557 RepID=UPI0036F1963D